MKKSKESGLIEEEYDTFSLKKYCEEQGIIHEFNAPYTHNRMVQLKERIKPSKT